MTVTKKTNYLILHDDKNDLNHFVVYLENIVPKNYENVNLVIDLLKYKNFNLSQSLLFLKISNYHRSTKYSFVLVNDTINFDDIPDELIVVPTLDEAGDIIEMEEIERDLGF